MSTSPKLEHTPEAFQIIFIASRISFYRFYNKNGFFAWFAMA